MRNDISPSGRGSHYVTRELARRALELTAPMIERARAQPLVVGSGFLYVVVMDPAMNPPGVEFEEAILYEQAFGDQSGWDAPHDELARAKARLSWSTGRNGYDLHRLSPHLLCEGDSLLSGGICLDGLVVAASGALPIFDEVFATTIAMWLRALARELRMKETAHLSL